MIQITRSFLCAATIAACVLLSATSCSFKIHRKGVKSGPGLAHPAHDIALDPNQIRLRMRALVEPFCGEIEQAADTIVAGTSDHSIKRAAILWKIEGVPAVRGALFQPDPFFAVFDTWVLTNQMADYFDTGAGREALGPAAPVAVMTSHQLEAELTEIAKSFTISKDVTGVRASAKRWAAEHPIRYTISDRESSLSRVTEQEAGADWTAGEVIGELATTADDVHREIQIYSAQLFRQARWETDLLKLDLPTGDVVPLAERAVKSSERAAASLDTLSPAITKAADAATKAADAAVNATSKLPPDMPALVTSERKAAVDAISGDLTETLTFLQGERIAALRQISAERIAALNQISDERVATMNEVREIAESERLALSRDIEKASMDVVDRAATRLTEIVAATVATIIVTVVLLLFLIRRLFFFSERMHRSAHGTP